LDRHNSQSTTAETQVRAVWITFIAATFMAMVANERYPPIIKLRRGLHLARNSIGDQKTATSVC